MSENTALGHCPSIWFSIWTFILEKSVKPIGTDLALKGKGGQLGKNESIFFFLPTNLLWNHACELKSCLQSITKLSQIVYGKKVGRQNEVCHPLIMSLLLWDGKLRVIENHRQIPPASCQTWNTWQYIKSGHLPGNNMITAAVYFMIHVAETKGNFLVGNYVDSCPAVSVLAHQCNRRELVSFYHRLLSRFSNVVVSMTLFIQIPWFVSSPMQWKKI